jgi:hypothetical protein
MQYDKAMRKDFFLRIFVFRERRNKPILLIEFEPETKQGFRTRKNFAKQMRK